MKPMRRVMSNIRQFTRFSFGDLIATAGPTVIVIAVLCAAAYLVVDPTPPRQVLLATGQENSAYEEFGKKYAAILAKQGIKVTLVRSLGSRENMQRMRDYNERKRRG